MGSKVVLLRCETYDPVLIYEKIKIGLEQLGGFDTLFGKEEKILLKPNLLTGKSKTDCATTHPAFFEAVAKLFTESADDIRFGDSPGFGKPEKVAEQCGLLQVARKYGIPLVEFKSGRTVSFPEGRTCKQFEIAEGVNDCDAIVSIPKMKAHQLTRITGAVKNQLGCVYGINKPAFHARFPNAVDFSRLLVDINRLLKPRLIIMDGITAMEGNGPSSGNPVSMNTIIMSTDPVAADAVFCRLINLPVQYVPSVVFGEKDGLGFSSEEDIELWGESVSSLLNRNFDVPRKPVKNEAFSYPIIKHFKGILTRKPVIQSEKCIKCGICVETCPVTPKALKFVEKNGPPKYQYRDCIRCYCCQEMCPEKAITVKRPFLF